MKRREDADQPDWWMLLCALTAGLVIFAGVSYIIKSLMPCCYTPQHSAKLVKTETPVPIRPKATAIRKRLPTCVRTDYLNTLLNDYTWKQWALAMAARNAIAKSSPERVHVRSREETGYIVANLAVMVLVASVIASAIEAYQALRKKDANPSGGHQRGVKDVDRKCSLADLTILRHNRKEMMMHRRESVCENGQKNYTNAEQRLRFRVE